jgi:cell division protein FtsX
MSTPDKPRRGRRQKRSAPPTDPLARLSKFDAMLQAHDEAAAEHPTGEMPKTTVAAPERPAPAPSAKRAAAPAKDAAGAGAKTAPAKAVPPKDAPAPGAKAAPPKDAPPPSAKDAPASNGGRARGRGTPASGATTTRAAPPPASAAPTGPSADDDTPVPVQRQLTRRERREAREQAGRHSARPSAVPSDDAGALPHKPSRAERRAARAEQKRAAAAAAAEAKATRDQERARVAEAARTQQQEQEAERARQRAAEAEAARKHKDAETAAREHERAAKAEAEQRKKEEEAAARAARVEAEQRKKEEEAAARAARVEAEQRKKEEEAAARAARVEAEQRRKAEESAAREQERAAKVEADRRKKEEADAARARQRQEEREAKAAAAWLKEQQAEEARAAKAAETQAKADKRRGATAAAAAVALPPKPTRRQRQIARAAKKSAETSKARSQETKAPVEPVVLPPKPSRRERKAARKAARAGAEPQLDLGLPVVVAAAVTTPPAAGTETAIPAEPDAGSARAARRIPGLARMRRAVGREQPEAPTSGVGAGQLVLVGGPQEDPRAAVTAPSTITRADLVNEAVAGLFSRPSRTILTVLGTMIGLTALVATLGLSRTASNRVVSRFDAIAATEVIVTPRPTDLTEAPNDIPWGAPGLLRRLNGVVAAGTLSKVDVGKDLVSASPLNDPSRRTDFRLAVQAASPGLFRAVRAKLAEGRFYDQGHSERADHVALLGANAARELGIHDLTDLPAISIGDRPFLVIGIIGQVARQDKLMSSVIIPEGTARDVYHLNTPDQVEIETQIGAAGLIADQARPTIRPDNPNGLKITAQPDLTTVRAGVSGDLDLLFLMLGAVSLLVGAIGIANVTLVSVMERTGEIGLRRALGATRRHVATQFLVESTAMGVLGGILGASLGIIIVVVVSAFQDWTPVLDAWTPIVAPIIGGVIGLVAGAYPAHRAASMEPVEALRAGT